MHMADALITPTVGGIMYAAATGAAIYSVKKIRKQDDFEKKIPLMGVVGAFVFAAQMINFSIPGTGSSGHICGGILLSSILGPEAGFLSIISVLLIQCLFFADGGLLALGCNIINMGFFGCFIGYKLIYKNVVKEEYSKKRIMVGAILASIVGLQCGAFSVVIETMASGITKLPFTTFLLFMQPIHLAIGLVEGIATGLVLCFVYENRPDILDKPVKKHSFSVSRRSVIAMFLAAAIIVGGGISLLASSDPDGLEWSIKRVTGSEELERTNTAQQAAESVQKKTAFMPDYGFKNASEGMEKAGTATAGLCGVIITACAAGGIAYAVKKKKVKEA